MSAFPSRHLAGAVVFAVGLLGLVVFGSWIAGLFDSTSEDSLTISQSQPHDGADAGRTVIITPLPDAGKLECGACGVVTSMRLIAVAADTAVRGTVGGAVVGSHIGNLLGGVRGQELFGLLGAIAGLSGGAAVRSDIRYETTIRFDNGSNHVFVAASRPQWRTGDRVRVIEGAIHAFSMEAPEPS
jgi:outer membrane lipoprotein SlyB